MSCDENQNFLTCNISSPIRNCYVNRTLFITGATGFCGKVLLAKLLGSLEDFRRIYVLIRPQKGLSGKDRFVKLISSRPFTFYDIPTKKLARIFPIEGDVTEKNLGMDEATYQRVVGETNIVFHAAASVKFLASAKFNLENNCIAAVNIVDMAKKMDNLECFVHVSTAFSNCQLKVVEENLYPLRVSARDILSKFRNLSETEVEEVAPDYYDGRPNSYTFTKAITEHLIKEIHDAGKRLAIVRPSIVGPAFKEPVQGWVDSIHGPVSLSILWTSGIICVIDWDFEKNPDFVPVDYLANCLISAPWFLNAEKEDFKVFNLCRSTFQHPSVWNLYEEIKCGLACSYKAPLTMVLRPSHPPPKFNRRGKYRYEVEKFFYQVLYAIFLDAILFITGKQPFLTRIVRKAQAGVESLKCFSNQEWTFKNDNVLKLLSHMSPWDKKDFNMEYCEPSLEKLSEQRWLGCRRFVLKQEDSTIGRAKLNCLITILLYRVFFGYVYYWLILGLTCLIGLAIPKLGLINGLIVAGMITRDVWYIGPLLNQQIDLGEKLVEYKNDTAVIGTECK